MSTTDATLVIFANKAMLATKRYPTAYDLWDDLDKTERTWGEWKTTYTKVDRKAVVKHMVAGNVEQFGGAAVGGALGSGGAEPPTGRPAPVTLGNLEGCFDSLAVTAVTGKDMLDELVKAIASLTKSNTTFTDTNARLAKKVEHQAEELKKKGG